MGRRRNWFWEPYPIAAEEAHGPATWVETQRVSRAFWRVEMFINLRSVAARSQLRWDEEDCVKLQSMDPHNFYDTGFCAHSGHHNEIKSTVTYLAEKRLGKEDIIGLTVPKTWSSLPPPEQAQMQDWPLPTSDATDTEELERSYQGGRAPYVDNFERYNYRHHVPLTTLPLMFPTDFFLPFGFVLWTKERLAASGFGFTLEQNSWDTWYSILTKAQHQTVLVKARSLHMTARGDTAWAGYYKRYYELKLRKSDS